MKKLFSIAFSFIILFSFSANAFAEEVRAIDVVVDQDNNTVQFIYGNEYNKPESAFRDIPNNSWYNMFVSYLKQTGIVNGMNENDFSPEQPIRRSEFIKMISLLSSEDISVYANSNFFYDSNSSDWYHSYVEWGANNNIINGDILGNFNGESNITREEAATMLYRFVENYSADIFNAPYVIEGSNYSDCNNISNWALEPVEKLTSLGILNGNDRCFCPQDEMSRAEAAKIISVYMILDSKPTILSEYSTPIQYVDVESEAIYDESLIETTDDVLLYSNSLNPLGDIPALSIPETTGVTPLWATNNHYTMLNRSFLILALDNTTRNTPAYISNLSTSAGTLIAGNTGKLSKNAQDYIRNGAMAPDSDETDSRTFIRHYYHYSPNLEYGIGTTKDGSSNNTAYHWFNNHYYWANLYYSWGDYSVAYDRLGRSIHYLADINAPHHAMLATNAKTDNNHTNYETWVRNNFYSEYWEWGSAASSYPYVCNSSFVSMSNNFSKFACEKYRDCYYFGTNTADALAATAELTKKTQRSVAGLLYRFLVDTGRAN